MDNFLDLHKNKFRSFLYPQDDLSDREIEKSELYDNNFVCSVFINEQDEIVLCKFVSQLNFISHHLHFDPFHEKEYKEKLYKIAKDYVETYERNTLS